MVNVMCRYVNKSPVALGSSSEISPGLGSGPLAWASVVNTSDAGPSDHLVTLLMAVQDHHFIVSAKLSEWNF